MSNLKANSKNMKQNENRTAAKSELMPLLSGGVHIQGLTKKGLKDEELANAFKKMIEAAHEKR